MHLLKQSTAASILVGPVLDSSGAAYTGMAIGDFNITKNGTSPTRWPPPRQPPMTITVITSSP